MLFLTILLAIFLFCLFGLIYSALREGRFPAFIAAFTSDHILLRDTILMPLGLIVLIGLLGGFFRAFLGMLPGRSHRGGKSGKPPFTFPSLPAAQLALITALLVILLLLARFLPKAP